MNCATHSTDRSGIPRPHLKRPLRLLIAVAAAAVACACGAKDNKPRSVEQLRADPAVKALMDKTLKNLRFVEGGTFDMGDFGIVDSVEKLYYTSSKNNKPMHKVTLDSFSMSAYKTTYADVDTYTQAMGMPKFNTDEHFVKRARFPDSMAGLIWQEARDYCQWLGKLLDLPMDLPTEAQWEYAARNRGKFWLFATDNGNVNEGRNVWEYDQLEKYQQSLARERGLDIDESILYTATVPLGRFPPTPLGLHDMITDGWEWTLDWFDADYYAKSPMRNPKGAETGTEKVKRSFGSKSGKYLEAGDGMTISRHRAEPGEPLWRNFDGKMVRSIAGRSETGARCVVNATTAVNAVR